LFALASRKIASGWPHLYQCFFSVDFLYFAFLFLSFYLLFFFSSFNNWKIYFRCDLFLRVASRILSLPQHHAVACHILEQALTSHSRSLEEVGTTDSHVESKTQQQEYSLTSIAYVLLHKTLRKARELSGFQAVAGRLADALSEYEKRSKEERSDNAKKPDKKEKSRSSSGKSNKDKCVEASLSADFKTNADADVLIQIVHGSANESILQLLIQRTDKSRKSQKRVGIADVV
jgi:hypothetical protein